MKKHSILLILFLICFCTYSQNQVVITMIRLTDNSKIGYGVEMYYLSEDVNEIINKAKNMTVFNEREVHKVFGLPLVEPQFSLGKCVQRDTLQISNHKLLMNCRKMHLLNGNFHLSIYVSLVFVNYCVFILHNKYWGSYDVNFREAAVITKFRKCKNKIPKKKLYEIVNILRSVPSEI